ncbi:MAG: metal-sensing transcriptional repressor [Clostridia bacterium]|nr:metal-sensing transcriptional repressor [Clostridia bacterium]
MEKESRSACVACEARKKKRSAEEESALLRRLGRVEGQVRALKRMVTEDVYCPDILIQAAAASAALDAFSRQLLESHLRSCVVADLAAGREGTVEELIDLLRKMQR